MLFTVALKDNKAFNRCFKTGNYCSCSMVTAYFTQNGTAQSRVGISVSKKVGNAVARNRAKRIIRAAYRLHESSFPIGCDIVFVAREDINGKKEQDISAFIEKRLLPVLAEPEAFKKRSGNKRRKKTDKGGKFAKPEKSADKQ